MIAARVTSHSRVVRVVMLCVLVIGLGMASPYAGWAQTSSGGGCGTDTQARACIGIGSWPTLSVDFYIDYLTGIPNDTFAEVEICFASGGPCVYKGWQWVNFTGQSSVWTHTISGADSARVNVVFWQHDFNTGQDTYLAVRSSPWQHWDASR